MATEKESKEVNSARKNRLSFRHREERLPIYRCGRSYLYAEGNASRAGNPVACGEVQIYFSLLPEIALKEMNKKRKRKRWMGKISDVLYYADETLYCRGVGCILFSDELCNVFQKEQELPDELYGVLLWMCRKQGKFRNISISLPEEFSFSMLESVVKLLEPYLVSARDVAFMGEETEGAMELEDYLYYEYGIVMSYEKYPVRDSIWLDFRKEETRPLVSLAAERNVCPVNYRSVLKFLDTTVKSGYNTKVN